ncbi:MAG: DNA replication/repair protein RecF [Clostridia bacterium]|nr:DNA replication/repair protein RecF [Clostridia bacterium]
MYLKRIKLVNFRNYQQQEIELSPNMNLFFGENAQGKTNILEAVFLCAIGKSFRAKKEKELINLEKKQAFVEIEYEKSDRSGKIKIILDDKKTIFLNDIKQSKLSDILGKINMVMFSPDDIEILKSSPAKRRRFLNIMISQLRPHYVHSLNMYQKTLEQRNNYLRQIVKENKPEEMLEIWDESLANYAKEIYEYRNEFVGKIKEKISDIHSQITDRQEELKIKYISDCENKETYKEELIKSRKADIERGYTSKGIHRDDIYFFINKKQVNIYGSQGQNRTVILSLKLAELEIIKDETEEYPILLLDDFMSELDGKRRENFLKNIYNTQILITCTEEFTICEKMCKNFQVKNGNVENKKE